MRANRKGETLVPFGNVRRAGSTHRPLRKSGVAWVKNPNPIKRAWRLERRRKELGSDNPRCFYCPESNIFSLELDHTVTTDLDPELTRAVCRNDHRKLEIERDLSGLTHNGRRDVHESKRAERHRYLLLLAMG